MDEFDVAVEHEDRQKRKNTKLKRGALASATVTVLALLFAAPSCFKDSMELFGVGKETPPANASTNPVNRNSVEISWLDLGTTEEYVKNQLGPPQFQRAMLKSGSGGLANDYTYALYDFPAQQVEILYDQSHAARIIVVKKMSQRPVPFHRAPHFLVLGQASLDNELFYVQELRLPESEEDQARAAELSALKSRRGDPSFAQTFKPHWENPYELGWMEYSNSKYFSYVSSQSFPNMGGYYNCLIACYDDDAQGPDAYAIYDIPNDWLDRRPLWDIMLDMVGQPSDMTREFLPFD